MGPEVGQGRIYMDFVRQGPKSHWVRSECFGVSGHLDLLVGTEVRW